MKKILFIAAVVLIAYSCSLIEKFTELDIESEMKLSYKIELDETDNTIDEEDIVSLEDDEDLDEYLDNLEKIQVDSIKLSITEYSGPETCAISGTLSYAKMDGTGGDSFHELTNFDIKGYFDSAEMYKILYDTDKIVAFSNLLLEEKSLKVFLKGTATDAPVTFKLNVIVYSNITVQALD